MEIANFKRRITTKVIAIYLMSWLIVLMLAQIFGGSVNVFWTLVLLIYYCFRIVHVNYSTTKKIFLGLLYWFSTGITAVLSSIIGIPGLATSLLAFYLLIYPFPQKHSA